ncbi:Uncharacterised protein [Haemophilus parahaemolyticus]|uniref:Uncharacterized protein n=1 Tax=Haemophilus parahaemolyticus TaxID=735 RepID=A0A377I308_HAEPH|nr:Uncharacterised protein [Haemophilus parahaemolyticus]
MEKITIRIRDKPQVRVKLAERKPIKINIHRLATTSPNLPPLSDLILNYKIGRL